MTGKEAARAIVNMIFDQAVSYSRDALKFRHAGFPNLADVYDNYAEAANIIANQILSDIHNGTFGR